MQMFGETEAWNYMDALHQNIALYTHSGSKPCALAGAGEYVVGLSYTFAAATQKGQGAPIDIILPEEGVGTEVGATFILKSSQKIDAAKAFLDWYLSDAGIEVYGQFSPMLAIAGVTTKPEFYPDGLLEHMLEPDLTAQVESRERVLAEWSTRFSQKDEPK
jgi:iron(III) transport system substrate-binding protein